MNEKPQYIVQAGCVHSRDHIRQGPGQVSPASSRSSLMLLKIAGSIVDPRISTKFQLLEISLIWLVKKRTKSLVTALSWVWIGCKNRREEANDKVRSPPPSTHTHCLAATMLLHLCVLGLALCAPGAYAQAAGTNYSLPMKTLVLYSDSMFSF